MTALEIQDNTNALRVKNYRSLPRLPSLEREVPKISDETCGKEPALCAGPGDSTPSTAFEDPPPPAPAPMPERAPVAAPRHATVADALAANPALTAALGQPSRDPQQDTTPELVLTSPETPATPSAGGRRYEVSGSAPKRPQGLPAGAIPTPTVIGKRVIDDAGFGQGDFPARPRTVRHLS